MKTELDKQQKVQEEILELVLKDMPVAFIGEESYSIRTMEDSLKPGKEPKRVIHAGLPKADFEQFREESQADNGSLAIVQKADSDLVHISLFQGGYLNTHNQLPAHITIDKDGSLFCRHYKNGVFEETAQLTIDDLLNPPSSFKM